LRHWFGTTVYRATKDLRLVQELMGHESIAVTQVYALVVPLDGAEVVRGLHLNGHVLERANGPAPPVKLERANG
jgi:site-specific recombinase XerD